jgi:hypothetical protein
MVDSIGDRGSHDTTAQDRFQTMSLGTNGVSTIGNTMKGTRANLAIATETNRVQDIEGARPELRALRYTRRPNLTTDITDISGSASRTLHPTNPNKVIGLNLTNADIEGTKPSPYTFKTQRVNDPLNPAYNLPSSYVEDAPVPKMMRETNQLTDIEGTAPKPVFKYKMRNNHTVQDIEGCATGWRPRHARRDGPARDIINCQDINVSGFKSQRVTDPLNPVHYVNGMAHLDDPLSRPKGLPRGRDGGYAPTLSLTTQDIEGAVPGWKPKHVNGGIPEEHRRHFRNTNFVADIAGAVADSLQHGIRTLRVSDPMQPNYRSLDGEPLLDSARLPDYPETEQYTAVDAQMQRGHFSVDKDARHDQSLATNTAQQIIAPPTPQGGQSQRGYTPDEKDFLIANLQAEVDQLRINSARAAQGASRGGYGGIPVSSRSAGQRSQRGSRPPSQSQQWGESQASQFRPSNAGMGAAQQFVAPRSTPRTADRMVLRSSNGQPRVPATPQGRRAEQQMQADIASVRGL